ncbi:TPA: AAA family ATPase [Vibrio parahaemolyticus]|nr:AAA family ATPase [Vibrio parahaemolyticus]HCE4792758.1 AAA family ATPase [Vibrio parahaemolyticus]HCH1612570.1 AAA family ATPase [Vibrio parahaemolyticus]HCH1614248.1 AAA family ATPase [Vibrio parahaemolyticus]
MNITIENCNSIDSATIALTDKKLNIKFAPNGTGKSTIARAITLHSQGDALDSLIPFKLKTDNPDSKAPSVTSDVEVNSVMCFNEEYVRQFTFQSDELVSNSFDIFIRTDAYNVVEEEIDTIVKEINGLFDGNEDLETFISNLSELGTAFTLTKSGLSQKSTGMKGLSQGNKLQHIPEGLEAYQPFISSSSNVAWIDWQTKGSQQFSELSDCCPYCSSDTTDKKEQITKVGEEYDKNVIKNLVKIIDVIDKLGNYFTEEAKQKLTDITLLPNGLEPEHVDYLKQIKTQIDRLSERLVKLKLLKGFDFKRDESVRDQLNAYKIDLAFLTELNSEATKQEIDTINKSIDEVVVKAGQLQGKLNQQRGVMKKLVEKYQTEINSFLSYAGYKYKVQISGEDDQSQLKLQHIDHDDFVSGGDQHLSFGERNAFAIVLFMYECLSKKPDLIILDDPISSFDKNKKYAILEMLFRRKPANCLKSKTVLMLTHDVEPIIDTVKAVKKQFDSQVFASYLRFDSGLISELAIDKSDIKTFSQICTDYLETEAHSILKLIYLRRYFEITDEMGDAYQVLSNLLHLRTLEEAEDRRVDGSPIMEPEKLDSGIAEILDKIDGFEYGSVLEQLQAKESLKELYDNCSNGYEKLQVFRLFKEVDEELDVGNSVIQKFINETYHIENEYICQLDPTKYDLIPEYVVKACDKFLMEAGL